MIFFFSGNSIKFADKSYFLDNSLLLGQIDHRWRYIIFKVPTFLFRRTLRDSAHSAPEIRRLPQTHHQLDTSRWISRSPLLTEV